MSVPFTKIEPWTPINDKTIWNELMLAAWERHLSFGGLGDYAKADVDAWTAANKFAIPVKSNQGVNAYQHLALDLLTDSAVPVPAIAGFYNPLPIAETASTTGLAGLAAMNQSVSAYGWSDPPATPNFAILNWDQGSQRYVQDASRPYGYTTSPDIAEARQIAAGSIAPIRGLREGDIVTPWMLRQLQAFFSDSMFASQSCYAGGTQLILNVFMGGGNAAWTEKRIVADIMSIDANGDLYKSGEWDSGWQFAGAETIVAQAPDLYDPLSSRQWGLTTMEIRYTNFGVQ